MFCSLRIHRFCTRSCQVRTLELWTTVIPRDIIQSAGLGPDRPGFGGTRWIASQDLNVEHLLDILPSIDANSNGVWDSYINSIRHLSRTGDRTPNGSSMTIPSCSHDPSRLFYSVGDHVEQKRLLSRALALLSRPNIEQPTDANQLLSLTRKGYSRQQKRWESTNGPMTFPVYYLKTNSFKTRKKLDLARSSSSWRKGKNSPRNQVRF